MDDQCYVMLNQLVTAFPSPHYLEDVLHILHILYIHSVPGVERCN